MMRGDVVREGGRGWRDEQKGSRPGSKSLGALPPTPAAANERKHLRIGSL